jgi:hypothetical protein
MKPPKPWTGPPPPNTYEDDLPEMSDEEAKGLLDKFRDQSLSNGYVSLALDFEKLMEAIYIATTWYREE